jgi:hypothetical protein
MGAEPVDPARCADNDPPISLQRGVAQNIRFISCCFVSGPIMSEHLIVTDWISVWRARIAELDLTLDLVDDLAGLSEGHTSKILRGVKKPTGETRDRLCAALALAQGVSIDVEREALLRAEAAKKKRD